MTETKTLRARRTTGDPSDSPTAPVNDSQSRHTPGPWTFDITEDREGGLVIHQGGYRVATAHRRIGYGVDDGYAQQVANAQLIVAAPDLLLIAHAAYHALESYAHGNGSPELAASIAAALALTIAKADGK